MIGFRSIAITVLMSYILVMVMGPFLIPVLHKMKFGQTVRDDGPQSHLKKNGTPTMGGVMFMVGITATVALFFTIFAFIVVQNVEISQFAAATLGACIGFMWFNVNPAKVFMGDTGSMALGGAVTAFALFTNSALLIPIVGGIYFAEALSVIIQVLYFKKTRKRVFKMAPLHHHYEQCGWPETKVVFIFWLVAALLAIIGVVAMF